MEQHTRVLIVGAGPAGIRAAETLCEAGLHPVVVDEGQRAGGQIYRRPPAGFHRTARQLYGSEAGKAQRLHALFDRLVSQGAVDYLPRASVLGIAEGQAQIMTDGTLRQIAFDRLILATGAMDRVMPVPGWQSAGVYTLGAAQIALKSQGVAMGKRIVLAGTGPLLTLVAHQLIKAGAHVAAVLDTSSLSTQVSASPHLLVRPWFAARGVMMRAGLGRRYHAGVTLDEITGTAKGPSAVKWRDGRGVAQSTACDMVAMGWHLQSETHLAALADIAFEYSTQWSQWLPVADRLGRAGNGRYVAGDSARILGADGAELTGRLAAIACLQDLNLPHPKTGLLLHRLKRVERFALGLSRAFPWPKEAVISQSPETVLCRCENVTISDLQSAVAEVGTEANRVKSISRVGMGRCQGRYCQLAAAELIAARLNLSVEQVGKLRPQAPVRPLPVSAALSESKD